MSRDSCVLRTRGRYLLSLSVIIALGLLSRRVAWLPNSAGDMFWVMMVYCFGRLLFVRWRMRRIAVVTLAIAFAVECSQHIRWEWLCRFRGTFVGHMMLGQGFMWQDLVAYVIGVVLILVMDKFCLHGKTK